jgi:hypothetical protein
VKKRDWPIIVPGNERSKDKEHFCFICDKSMKKIVQHINKVCRNFHGQNLYLTRSLNFLLEINRGGMEIGAK